MKQSKMQTTRKLNRDIKVLDTVCREAKKAANSQISRINLSSKVPQAAGKLS